MCEKKNTWPWTFKIKISLYLIHIHSWNPEFPFPSVEINIQKCDKTAECLDLGLAFRMFVSINVSKASSHIESYDTEYETIS